MTITHITPREQELMNRVAELEKALIDHTQLKNSVEKPIHPSLKPFECPVCRSHYFGPLWHNREHVGRYCKGWPSGMDRSYIPCKASHEELFNPKTVDAAIDNAMQSNAARPESKKPKEDVAQIIYALERQASELENRATTLANSRDYSAEFPAEDALRLREAIDLLSQQNAK